MIRRLLLASSTLALMLMLATTAQAQLNLRGLKFPAALQNMGILRTDEVQKELKLNDEQKQKLQELGVQLQQEAFEILSGLQDLTPEEQKEMMPEIMEMVADKGKEVQGKVDNILEDQQRSRLKELSLQARGAQALEDDDLGAELNISDEQRKKLAEIREEGNTAIQETMQKLRADGGDQGEIREQITALREKLQDKAQSVLTAEQIEKFKQMQGEAFEFPRRRGGLPF